MPPDSRPLPDAPEISDDGWNRAYQASRSAATTDPCRCRDHHRRQTSATCADQPHRRWSAHRACPGAGSAGGYPRRAEDPLPVPEPPRPRGWPDPDAAAAGRSGPYDGRGDDAALLPRKLAATACPHPAPCAKAALATNTAAAAAPPFPAVARPASAGSEAATAQTPDPAVARPEAAWPGVAQPAAAAEAGPSATEHAARPPVAARGRRPTKAESAALAGRCPCAAVQPPPCRSGAAHGVRPVTKPPLPACPAPPVPGRQPPDRQAPGRPAPTPAAGAPLQPELGAPVLSGRPNVPSGQPWPGWPWPGPPSSRCCPGRLAQRPSQSAGSWAAGKQPGLPGLTAQLWCTHPGMPPTDRPALPAPMARPGLAQTAGPVPEQPVDGKPGPVRPRCPCRPQRRVWPADHGLHETGPQRRSAQGPPHRRWAPRLQRPTWPADRARHDSNPQPHPDLAGPAVQKAPSTPGGVPPERAVHPPRRPCSPAGAAAARPIPAVPAHLRSGR